MPAVLPGITFASTIDRLPAAVRSAWLRKISANANAPGGAKKQIGRSQQQLSRHLSFKAGITPIETRVTAPLTASVAIVGAGTVSTGGGTPASLTFVAGDAPKSVTWAAPGAKTLAITSSPVGAKGEAVVIV